jgi:hypothetical protein
VGAALLTPDEVITHLVTPLLEVWALVAQRAAQLAGGVGHSARAVTSAALTRSGLQGSGGIDPRGGGPAAYPPGGGEELLLLRPLLKQVWCGAVR